MPELEEELKTGWLPHTENAVQLKFSAYANMAALPRIPDDFGHEEWNPAIDWCGPLGNTRYGNCVVAGGAHESIPVARIGGKVLAFHDRDVINDFAQILKPIPLNTVAGADMKKAASYRLHTGLLGADGVRHKIGAYVELPAGDLRALKAAMYLSDGMVGCGLRFYHQWFDAFRRGNVAWAITSGMVPTLMGHYLPMLALRGGNFVTVTWGRFQAIRQSVIPAACQQALMYLSPEALVNQKSPEGFKWLALIDDMRQIVG